MATKKRIIVVEIEAECPEKESLDWLTPDYIQACLLATDAPLPAPLKVQALSSQMLANLHEPLMGTGII